MADLDIAERRRPQDGRIRFNDAGTAIDLRVSTLPTCFGEKIVLRVLDASSVPLTLEGVGLNGDALDDVRTTVRRPHGLVLVTGPTGSGKSTTLYAALNERNTPDVNIVTAEDPIEYRMAGLNQTAIRPDLGFGFAEALRSFLRQDPDVVMVGEIRDTETARVAVRAALTGHLVLSTLHTNDAARTIGRLIDMQVEPYLLASSLKLVLAQRLVRRLCNACKEPESPEAPVRQEFGVARDQPTYSAVGCPACAGTGYRGRLALFERLVIGETLSQAIASRESPAALCRRAAQAGYPSLRDEALQAVYAGDTSLAELLRVVV
ncbi:MAG: GspE/PulE family protein, partial [Bacteroidota bacterium]